MYLIIPNIIGNNQYTIWISHTFSGEFKRIMDSVILIYISLWRLALLLLFTRINFNHKVDK